MASDTVSVRPVRFHRTAAFRLALLIALLFSALTVIQFAIVYWDFSSFARAQLRSTIEHEASQLAKEAEEEDVAHIVERLRSLQTYVHGRAFAYAVFDASGVRLLGSMARPPGAGWHQVPVKEIGETDEDAHSETAIAYALTLPDGATLVVARDTDDFVDLRKRIAETLSFGAALTVLLALLGGVIISRRSLRRVDDINRTAEHIMTGDLSQRLPRWGSGDEFDRLSDVLNRMLQRIETLMLDVRHVSSDIAHDLRTPLARLRQGLEALSEEAVSPADYHRGIDKALTEIDDVLDTFAALLRIAEVEAGARKAGFRSLDLSALCRQIAETYAPVIEDDGRSFVVGIDPDVSVRGDPELLTQAVANLIENALRHTPTGTPISLGLTATADQARLAVADRGQGIPPEARGSVLGRFSRLDQSRSSSGHGLGLALVAAVAELHGASLALRDNRPGLRIEVTMPTESRVNPSVRT
ncbi:MAG: HAMP domain-containing sensor histidine kinase [Hyphomicrobiaceae bacterium]